MRKRGCETDKAGGLIDGGRLYRRNLMLAECFAHNVETAGERRITEAAIGTSRPPGADRCRQRFLGIDQFGLRLGQGTRQGGYRFTGPLHDYPPRYSKDRS